MTIRPNRKAKFDRKAENVSSLISAQYICSNTSAYYIKHVVIYWVDKFSLLVFYLFGPLLIIFGPPVFIYSAIRIRPYDIDPLLSEVIQ